jgi:hypoxanthine phosphoribosyltransferase
MSTTLTTIDELTMVEANADCLYSETAVEQAIAECAKRAASQIASLAPVVLTVMNGGLSFADRLLAHWDFPLELDYIHFSRYDGALSGGQNKQIAEPQTPINGRHVVVVDDIFDEGLTLTAVVDWAKAKGASGVTTVILADKQHQRKQTNYQPDYVALTVPDRYVYGFGMDYKGWLRNKRGIYALAEPV